jgi:hypothetical protein
MTSWPFSLVDRNRPTYVLLAFGLGALHLGFSAWAMKYLPSSASGENTNGGTWVYSVNPGWTTPLLFSIQFTYLLLVGHFVLRGARKDCARLQQVVGEAAAREAQEQLVRFPRIAWSTLPIFGIAFWLAHMAVMGELQDILTWYSRMPGYALWIHLDVLLFELAASALIFCYVRTAWILYRLGDQILDIDLLDVRPLQTFSRTGPRMALSLTGSLLLTLPFVGFDASFFLVPLLITIVVSLALFLLPLVKLRRQVLLAREETLGLIGQALRGDRAALKGTRFEAVHSLADLVVLRQAVASVPSWPVSESRWWRFGTVVLLPLLSWGASQAIDRLL